MHISETSIDIGCPQGLVSNKVTEEHYAPSSSLRYLDTNIIWLIRVYFVFIMLLHNILKW